MTVKHIETLDEFLEETQQVGTVVVKVSTSTCGPCKMMAPVFEKASEEDYGFSPIFVSLSPEDSAEISTYARTVLRVSSVPTFIVFKDSVVVNQFSGALPLTQFKARLGL